MPPRKSADAATLGELRQEVSRLRDHIEERQVIICDILEEFVLLTGNRRPAAPASITPVLKRMAADPCADDWNERLLIIRGDEQRDGESGARQSPSVPSPARTARPDSQVQPPGQRELF